MATDYSKYSDKQLVKLLKGDKKEAEAAFTELFDRYSLRVNAYCLTIVGDKEKAEDIFQETFIKFYQNARSDFKEGSVIGFLITIARNLSLNAKRNEKSTIPIEDFDIKFNDDDSYENKELSELVMMAMDLLPEKNKEALVLRYFNDLRYKEIADILNITPARARYLVFNAKQKIKEILLPYLKDVYNL